MNKKSKFTFYLFLLLGGILILQILYLGSEQSMTENMREKKVLFVQLTGLPDLALYSNSNYIRHRSLSLPSDIYALDGCLREYDSATYAINDSTIASLK